MKQIIQDLKTGETVLENVPKPQVNSQSLLIQTTHSLVSLGTERMLVEFGKANYLEKARQQPDKVKQVLEKMKTDGIGPTVDAVFNKMNQPLPLGYCNVGKVIAVGEKVRGFKIGDRVASNGPHAEIVSIPENLCANIPDGVTDEEAAFTVIGSIALQGIRLVRPQLGETIVVFGLGLIGLITSELLISSGCKVIGIDFDADKIALAKDKGIKALNPLEGVNSVQAVLDSTYGIGADAVIITASAHGDDIVHQSAEMSRKRGRIILVGVVDLNLRRDDFFKKELTFQVSCSYGPGRYDDQYEQKGIDYPIAYVRWTEKRNFEAILSAIATGHLDVKSLISEIVDLADYEKIYGDMRKKGIIASLLRYPQDSLEKPSSRVEFPSNKISASNGIMGIIGAGNFTSSTIVPALNKAKANIKYIASSGGLTAVSLAKKGKINFAVTDRKEILNDDEVAGVLITTRHNLHAEMVIEALKAGKHVFVEKPLALNKDELDEIVQIFKESRSTLTVGFNRRFSPHAQIIKKHLGSELVNIVATMNAGFIPPEMWVHDLSVGGGRIIGEACHLIDLCSYFTGSRITAVSTNVMGLNPEENFDNASILLKYENGSTAVINYFANGSKSYAKERVEVYSQGKVFVIDNWRKTTAYGVKRFRSFKTKLDKGHSEQFRLLKETWEKGDEPLIPFDSIVNTTLASFAAIQSMKEKRWVEL